MSLYSKQSVAVFIIGAVCWVCVTANLRAETTPDPNQTTLTGDWGSTRLSVETAPDFNQTTLTGDWGGTRTTLSDNGITFDIDAVLSSQGVLDGGTNRSWQHGGSMEYLIEFDFNKMGLWDMAFLDVRVEHQFGDFVNKNTGTFFAANTEGLFPLPNYNNVNVSEVKYTQFLSEDFAVFFGKINTLDGDDNVFAGGRGKTNFMNQNFVFNPVPITTVPYSSLGVGAMKFFPNALAEDPAILTFMVLGADGKPNTSGFDSDFENGESYIVGYRQPTRFFDKSGSHTFVTTYGTKDYTLLNQDPRLALGALADYPVTLEEKGNSWSFTYNMHQYLYTEQEDPTQGYGVFGRLGFADEETSPIADFYSVGIGGKGMIDGRDNDTYGIGYFYATLSDEFGSVIQHVLGDAQGLELFYNIELTKWLHITPDFQIIEPSDRTIDTIYIAGLRAKIDF
jgi:porin